MKKETFIKFEAQYKSGTFMKYGYKRDMELYAPKNRATDNGNEIISVEKVTQGVARIVNYGKINSVIRDNLIKDLCTGLYNDENKNRVRFTLTYGTNVDLDTYSIKELTEMVQKFSKPGARLEDQFVRKYESVPQNQKISRFVTEDTATGTLYLSVMPTHNRLQSANVKYIVSEVASNGEVITKTMTSKEFAALGKVAKTSTFTSNRFAKESSYTKLVEAGILKDINAPLESTTFKLKLENLTNINDVKEDAE